jgi:hypothetical protein
MSNYIDVIDRLGFDSWCNNLVVDQIENITTNKGKTTLQDDDMSFSMSWGDGKGVASIRAYTSSGWQETTIEFKLP